MKAVILAAGEGKRMRPLTLKNPKPLLLVNKKPIIDYVFEAFPREIDEVIVVVKYLGHKIKKYLGKAHKGKKIKYAQGSDLGTAYSFLAAKKYLSNEKFLFIYGDEIPNPRNVEKCLNGRLNILVFRSDTPEKHGIVYLRKDRTVGKIVEKPKKTKSHIAIDGIMVLNTDIFNYSPKKNNGEYYFSSMVGSFVKDHRVFPVYSADFIGDLTSPADLKRVGKALRFRNDKQ